MTDLANPLTLIGAGVGVATGLVRVLAASKWVTGKENRRKLLQLARLGKMVTIFIKRVDEFNPIVTQGAVDDAQAQAAAIRGYVHSIDPSIQFPDPPQTMEAGDWHNYAAAYAAIAREFLDSHQETISRIISESVLPTPGHVEGLDSREEMLGAATEAASLYDNSEYVERVMDALGDSLRNLQVSSPLVPLPGDREWEVAVHTIGNAFTSKLVTQGPPIDCVSHLLNVSSGVVASGSPAAWTKVADGYEAAVAAAAVSFPHTGWTTGDIVKRLGLASATYPIHAFFKGADGRLLQPTDDVPGMAQYDCDQVFDVTLATSAANFDNDMSLLVVAVDTKGTAVVGSTNLNKSGVTLNTVKLDLAFRLPQKLRSFENVGGVKTAYMAPAGGVWYMTAMMCTDRTSGTTGVTTLNIKRRAAVSAVPLHGVPSPDEIWNGVDRGIEALTVGGVIIQAYHERDPNFSASAILDKRLSEASKVISILRACSELFPTFQTALTAINPANPALTYDRLAQEASSMLFDTREITMSEWGKISNLLLSQWEVVRAAFGSSEQIRAAVAAVVN